MIDLEASSPVRLSFLTTSGLESAAVPARKSGSPSGRYVDLASSLFSNRSRSWRAWGERRNEGQGQRRCRDARHRFLRARWLGSALAGLCLFAIVLRTLWGWGTQGFNTGLGDVGKGSGSKMPYDVIPARRIMACSHNDEMQGSNALQLALSLGYGYIEVDTHLGPNASQSDSAFTLDKSSIEPSSQSVHSNSLGTPVEVDGGVDPSLTLLVGHNRRDLDPTRTLKNLYLDPLLGILDKHNTGRNVTSEGWNGVYANDPHAEVVLMIDMKVDGQAIWPYLIAGLQPFLRKGYLTTYDPKTMSSTRGPLTIVGTGLTPIQKVYYQSLRYVFYDAPLLQIDSSYTLPRTIDGPAVTFEWDATISPIASSKFPLPYYLAMGSKPGKAKQNYYTCRLVRISSAARARGIQSRWWGVARYPGWLRRRMWQVVWMSNVGVMNADDLGEMKLWLDGKDDKERLGLTC